MIHACTNVHVFKYVQVHVYLHCILVCSILHYTSRRSKQINRRATGVPGRMKLPSFYEQTDPDPSDRQRHPAKRSVSNVSSFHPPPVQPPPILSANPTSPGSKRRFSTDPEVTTPQSASSSAATTPAAGAAPGGNNENLALAPLNEEKKSRESSRQSSVNRLSGLSEDEEMGNYEPIDGYLLNKQKSDSIKVPTPQRSVESSPKSQSLSQRSSISDAPHYPAPLPPALSSSAATTQQDSNNNKSPPRDQVEDDEDSDGYEPVQLAGQDDGSDEPRFKDEVERAVLPLKPGAMRVGQGQPVPQPRSRDRSPSYTGSHPSAALRQFSRERSPTVVQNRVSSESPPNPSILSSSVPVGVSHLIRPPIKEKSASPPKWTETKSKVVMPPEPSSPPPSPPVSSRDVNLPPGGRPTLTQRQKSPSPPAVPPGHPVLPPKKKSARNPSYESHVLQSQSANDDEGIYSFDRLSQPPPPTSIAKATTGSPRRVPSPSNPVTMATGEQQDNIYFDHLVSGPPLPQKPAVPAPQSSLTSQTSQPDGVNADNVYFDHLSSGPPPSAVPPSVPSKPSMTSEQPVQQDEVYFDHLVSGPPPPLPPNHPRKPSTTTEQPVQQDDVYFDHLVSGPPTIPGKTGQASLPRSGPPGKTGQASVPEPQPGVGGGEDDDQVYFDHLVSNEPVKPVQPVSAPKLPPRRQSSVSSDMKQSNGVKRPVSQRAPSKGLLYMYMSSARHMTVTCIAVSPMPIRKA